MLDILAIGFRLGMVLVVFGVFAIGLGVINTGTKRLDAFVRLGVLLLVAGGVMATVAVSLN